ncbi:MAG: alanine racemase, partial [Emcibacter sp.]|nr:alanine racemase [Emcibacter sp.]
MIDDFPTSSQATLTIDLNAIINNYKSCIKLAKGVESAAMVKANAYGMGIDQVASALFHNGGCRIFFVADLAEGITLRRALPDAVIYVLNGIFPGHLDYFALHNIRPVLYDIDQIHQWAKFSPEKPLPCAIHFDTGINRLGLDPVATNLLIKDAALRATLNISLIMSHLACSDDKENPLNTQQLKSFKNITGYFPGIPASLANSGGLLLGPEYHFDLVRPGLLLYGGNPGTGPLPKDIQNILQVTGKVLQVRSLSPGQTVGYGMTWIADKPCHIATINIGYADGYLQVFNNCGQAFAKGTLLPIVGRVSMDMIAVDVTDIEI